MPPINKPIIEIHNPQLAKLYRKALDEELNSLVKKKYNRYKKLLEAKETGNNGLYDEARRKYEILLDNIEEINLQINIIDLNL